MRDIPEVRKTFEYNGYDVVIVIELLKTIKRDEKGIVPHEYFNARVTMDNARTKHSLPVVKECLYFNTLTTQVIELEEKARRLIDYAISPESRSIELSLTEMGYTRR